nr:iron-containing alcohol dehydrogenase [Sedimentibacter sp.]
MYKLYCRLYQRVLQAASYFTPWRKPELLEGKNSLSKLPDLINSKGIKNVLIVTDKGISSLGLMNGLLDGLNIKGIKYVIYDKTIPNPTVQNIEEAVELYKFNHCEAIIAFGGGSSMDCAKGVGARITKPHKNILQMKGLLKVRKKLPPLFAIPTTSGTGSEATIAAVISDTNTHEKYQVNDIVLIPHYAVLDPLLTVGLPKNITSTTGMDALTHAVEAYIGNSNTRETKRLSKKAVKLIFDNIETAYTDGKNLQARENMLKASFYAGVAFTRAYIGYVHAIAHALGGFYGIPHGLANAVVLPYVLEYYGKSAHRQLAELAEVVGIGLPTDTNGEKATKFINAIRELNRAMNIPEKISEINSKDIPLMAERAWKEANPFYPVPRILSKRELENVFQMVSE